MITNGTVTIEDGLKAKEEYAPARKVSVSISFAVPPDEPDDRQEVYVTAAGDMANAHVARLLGTAAPVVAPKAPVTPKKRETTPKPAEKTKADLAKEAGLPTTDTTSGPALSLGDELTAEPEKPAAEAAKPAEEDLSDLLGESAPAPVTDAELGKAASTKNGALATKHGAKYDPTAIRKLVSKYNGEVAGKKLADIPAAKRHDFLKELDALT